mmetsp:Transcript_47359/g.119922  ORF Transcript_47359/g.119922 Transcript_47359/m.119922 type:complete len:125 (+) Transcript_47359:178-552(+)
MPRQSPSWYDRVAAPGSSIDAEALPRALLGAAQVADVDRLGSLLRQAGGAEDDALLGRVLAARDSCGRSLLHLCLEASAKGTAVRGKAALQLLLSVGGQLEISTQFCARRAPAQRPPSVRSLTD